MDRAEQLKIFARCLGDPIYGIETFLKTFDLTQEGMVPFKLFYKQKEVIKSYEEFNRNLVTKPRQAGVSTTTAAIHKAAASLCDESHAQNGDNLQILSTQLGVGRKCRANHVALGTQ